MRAILSSNLVPTCPHSKLFPGVGLRWLAQQSLPDDVGRSVDALLRQIDFHGDELAKVERDIAIDAVDDPVIARLMTVPGIHVTVAMSIVAAVGDSRFETPKRLVSRLRLNPRVSQSGNGPAKHGLITKAGRAQARGMMVEAAFAASRASGPLRAFYRRIKDRARVPNRNGGDSPEDDGAVLAPDHERRGLRLRSTIVGCAPVAGPSHDYFIKELRDAEKALVEQEERAYEILVAHWQPQGVVPLRELPDPRPSTALRS